MSSSTPLQAQAVGPAGATPGGLTFSLAATVGQVMAAWGMVYRAYLAAGLISPNPYRLHSAPEAIGGDTAVICGNIGGVTVSTLTAILDPVHIVAKPQRLPLDHVCAAELRALRAPGRRLVQACLFADRRAHLARSSDAMLELTRLAFHFGRAHAATDLVIGVHPAQAEFYAALFDLRVRSAPRPYPPINHQPVVLMHADLLAAQHREPPHPTYAYFADRPVARQVLQQRFAFTHEQVAGTPLQGLERELLARRALSQTA